MQINFPTSKRPPILALPVGNKAKFYLSLMTNSVGSRIFSDRIIFLASRDSAKQASCRTVEGVITPIGFLVSMPGIGHPTGEWCLHQAKMHQWV